MALEIAQCQLEWRHGRSVYFIIYKQLGCPWQLLCTWRWISSQGDIGASQESGNKYDQHIHCPIIGEHQHEGMEHLQTRCESRELCNLRKPQCLCYTRTFNWGLLHVALEGWRDELEYFKWSESTQPVLAHEWSKSMRSRLFGKG